MLKELTYTVISGAVCLLCVCIWAYVELEKVDAFKNFQMGLEQGKAESKKEEPVK